MNVVNHTHLFHIINVSSIGWHFNGKRTQIQIEATFLKLLWTDFDIIIAMITIVVVVVIIFFAFISSNYRILVFAKSWQIFDRISLFSCWHFQHLTMWNRNHCILTPTTFHCSTWITKSPIISINRYIHASCMRIFDFKYFREWTTCFSL